MNTQSTLMIDAIGSKVPSILAHYGTNHPVQGYLAQPGVLSYIPWSKAQLAAFPHGHILTATMPGRPEDAQHARELDREALDAGDDDVAPWLIARHEFNHDDGQIYVDLSNLAGVLQAIQAGGIWNEPWWRLRIAWYWDRPTAPNLGQVMTAIDNWVPTSLLPDPRRIWAAQWAARDVDFNAVYGPLDFTRP